MTEDWKGKMEKHFQEYGYASRFLTGLERESMKLYDPGDKQYEIEFLGDRGHKYYNTIFKSIKFPDDYLRTTKIYTGEGFWDPGFYAKFFYGCYFKSVEFKNIHFTNCIFEDCIFCNVGFYKCRATGSQFIGSFYDCVLDIELSDMSYMHTVKSENTRIL